MVHKRADTIYFQKQSAIIETCSSPCHFHKKQTAPFLAADPPSQLLMLSRHLHLRVHNVVNPRKDISVVGRANSNPTSGGIRHGIMLYGASLPLVQGSQAPANHLAIVHTHLPNQLRLSEIHKMVIDCIGRRHPVVQQTQALSSLSYVTKLLHKPISRRHAETIDVTFHFMTRSFAGIRPEPFGVLVHIGRFLG